MRQVVRSVPTHGLSAADSAVQSRGRRRRRRAAGDVVAAHHHSHRACAPRYEGQGVHQRNRRGEHGDERQQPPEWSRSVHGTSLSAAMLVRSTRMSPSIY